MNLYINCCAREQSRTDKLARKVLEQLDGDITELKLYEEPVKPLDADTLNKRTELIEKGDYSDTIFDYAKQFASADTIVIAAPYWDLSFPAILKQYLEKINVPGITFFYTEAGVPQGLCRAEELVYVMTAGGTYVPEAFGFGYVKALAENFYGIQNVRLVQRTGLDL